MTTDQQGLAQPSNGQADWDTDLNGNVSIIERGYRVKATAGTAINTGMVGWVNSGGFVFPYDPRSLTIRPQVLAYKSVGSGEQDFFLAQGAVRSLAIFSACVPGEQLYVSSGTAGLIVGSYENARHSIGYGIAQDGLFFSPARPMRFFDLFGVGSGVLSAAQSGSVLAVNTNGTDIYFIPVSSLGGGGGGGTGSGTLYGRQPAPTTWTQINSKSVVWATIADSALLMSCVGCSDAFNIHPLLTAATSNVLLIQVALQMFGQDVHVGIGGGIAVQNSTNSRCLSFGWMNLSGAKTMHVGRWSSPTAFSTTMSNQNFAAFNGQPYVRARWDTSTIYFEWSAHRANSAGFWRTLFAEPLSSFIGTIDLVGVALWHGNGQIINHAIFHDWTMVTSV